MNRVDVNTDGEKRGKLLLLAAFIALAIFISKILQSQTQVLVWRVYLNAFIYFVIVFVGLIWAFSFQIKKKSLLFILQPALFVFSEVLFIEFFFFQKFNRIYEVFILLILMGLVFLGNYLSFLMANVFNVDLFKKIPLVQVGRTSSYLLSLLMLYFFSFSFLVTGLEIYFLLPLILLAYFLVIYINYLNMGMEEGELYRKTFLTLAICFSLFLGLFLSGDSHEIVSAIPILGYYSCVSVVTQEKISRSLSPNTVMFGLFLVIAFLVALFINILN